MSGLRLRIGNCRVKAAAALTGDHSVASTGLPAAEVTITRISPSVPGQAPSKVAGSVPSGTVTCSSDRVPSTFRNEDLVRRVQMSAESGVISPTLTPVDWCDSAAARAGISEAAVRARNSRRVDWDIAKAS